MSRLVKTSIHRAEETTAVQQREILATQATYFPFNDTEIRYSRHSSTLITVWEKN